MKTALNKSRFLFCWAILATLLPGFVTAQNVVEKMIPSSAMAAIFLKPKDALSQPGMELVPHEVITAMGQQEFGFDPCDITQIVLLVDTITDTDNPPGFGVVVQFGTPQSMTPQLIDKLNMNPGEMNGMKVFRCPGDREEVLLQKDEKTFVFGFESFVGKMLSASGAKSGLIDQIKTGRPDGHFDAYVSIEPVRGFIKQQLAEQLPPMEQIPPPFRDFIRLPDLIDSFSFNSSFAKQGYSIIRVNAIDNSGAKEIDSTVRKGIATAKQFMMAQIASEMRDQDPVLRDSLMAYINRVADYFEKQFKPEISGNSLAMDFASDESAQLANVGTIGVLVGMLLPAVQQVREAARRTSAMNNLRQMSLAALNYESAYLKFPAQANYSKDGKPLLSWRVHLLPFMEYGHLYDQFKLDEPWDSEHNIKLLDQMPPIYKGPNSVHTNKTSFLGISGKGTMFDGTTESTLGSISDGTSNTIFFVEVNDDAAVFWTKPGDYELNLEDPMWGLMGTRPGGFNATFVDGSTRFISSSIDIATLKLLMLKADGKPIQVDY